MWIYTKLYPANTTIIIAKRIKFCNYKNSNLPINPTIEKTDALLIIVVNIVCAKALLASSLAPNVFIKGLSIFTIEQIAALPQLRITLKNKNEYVLKCF